MPYRGDLECEVLGLEYSFDRRAGRLYTPTRNDGPDMLAAISFFQKLDPHVRKIGVLDGRQWSTTYERDRRTGEWEATRQTERQKDRS
jgi:hypothetical protein